MIRRKLHALTARKQWILLYHLGNALCVTPERFVRLMPPNRRTIWADPFPIHVEGRHHVFIEEMIRPAGKAHISVFELRPDGTATTPVKVLERPYHLSYPFVFKHGDDYYMLPETRRNQTIELYRAVDFPWRWEFSRNLMTGISAADATLHYDDDRWWLFASVAESPEQRAWSRLCAFHAADLFTERWEPHPQNPIVEDLTNARPAGSIFRHNGKLYRPSQNCEPFYGYATNLNVISTLSTRDYAEEQVSTIQPGWDQGIIGTHTLNYADGLTVIDALYERNLFGR